MTVSHDLTCSEFRTEKKKGKKQFEYVKVAQRGPLCLDTIRVFVFVCVCNILGKCDAVYAVYAVKEIIIYVRG